MGDKILLSHEERTELYATQARTRAIKGKVNKARKRERRPSTKARVRDADFLAWLHDGIPCIACLIEGAVMRTAGTPTPYHIEAAHQKHVAGKGGMLGKRPDDGGHTCPLCAWHHRLAPDACDPAQRKFWARLGVDVGEFCAALFAAFKAGGSGAAVVRVFAQRKEPLR